PNAWRAVLPSIAGEAVEKPGPTGALQILLAAAPRCMHRIPRRVPAAGTVVMAELGSAGAAAGPVLAGMVAIGIGPAVRLRARQHIVLVRTVSETFDRLAFLGQRRRLGNVIAETRVFRCIAVQVPQVLSDSGLLGVVPCSLTDAVPRINRGLTDRGASTEISPQSDVP